jgi:hypothetical protein
LLRKPDISISYRHVKVLHVVVGRRKYSSHGAVDRFGSDHNEAANSFWSASPAETRRRMARRAEASGDSRNASGDRERRGARARTDQEALLQRQPQIQAWLKEDRLILTKIHWFLGREGLAVPYPTLHRFARKHCGLGKPGGTVRRIEGSPGELRKSTLASSACCRNWPVVVAVQGIPRRVNSKITDEEPLSAG